MAQAWLDTEHRDPIHVAQLDHYGKRLATASSDHRVRVFDVETRRLVVELGRRNGPPIGRDGHAGAIWAVAWAHPKYGQVLASAGEDKLVLIWRGPRLSDSTGETEDDYWNVIGRHDSQGPVIAAAFSPWEYGLQLATASCDGIVTVLSHNGAAQLESDAWRKESFHAHEGGAFAVCWAPAASPAVSSDAAEAQTMHLAAMGPRRLVSGGADHTVRIWRYDAQSSQWVDQHRFPEEEHGNFVRDVAWRPNMGIPSNTVASCDEDGTVVIWTQAMLDQPWTRQFRLKLDAAAWQLSWAVTGSILAVSTSANGCYLLSETREGEWQCEEVPEEAEEPSIPEGPAFERLVSDESASARHRVAHRQSR